MGDRRLAPGRNYQCQAGGSGRPRAAGRWITIITAETRSTQQGLQLGAHSDFCISPKTKGVWYGQVKEVTVAARV